MSQVLFIRELEPEDAKAMGRLERKLYPAKFREGWQSIKSGLEEADAYQCNLSIGMFDGKRLVGYILAYCITTDQLKKLPDIEGTEDDEIIYCNDFVVDHRYRQQVYQLLDRFFYLTRRDFPQHSVVAHGLQARMNRWIKKHQKTFVQFGYRLTQIKDMEEAGLEQDLYLAQWRPIPYFEQPEHQARSDIGSISPYDINGHAYNVELIQNEIHWQTLQPFWNDLLNRTSGHTVFQTFEYLQLWWRYFGLSRKLFILALWRDNTLIGIAPLQISPTEILGKYYRELGFLGSRWEVDRPTFLFPICSQDCHEATVRFLLGKKDQWDLCQLYEQMPASPAFTHLQARFAERGYLVGTTEDSVCPYLHFDSTWKEFLASKSQKFRKNLKASRRKLEALGKLEFKTYWSSPQVEQQLERYQDLENRSWKIAKKVGCNRSSQHSRFYQDLAISFGANDQFYIRFLMLDDNPIAGTFGLLHEGVCYSLQITHDPAYSKYSPGTLLEALELEQCFSSGYKEYDFLGGFLNNKLRWTSLARHTTQVHVFCGAFRLRLFYFLYFILKPGVKRILQQLGLMKHLQKLQSRIYKLRKKGFLLKNWTAH